MHHSQLKEKNLGNLPLKKVPATYVLHNLFFYCTVKCSFTSPYHGWCNYSVISLKFTAHLKHQLHKVLYYNRRLTGRMIVMRSHFKSLEHWSNCNIGRGFCFLLWLNFSAALLSYHSLSSPVLWSLFSGLLIMSSGHILLKSLFSFLLLKCLW